MAYKTESLKKDGKIISFLIHGRPKQKRNHSAAVDEERNIRMLDRGRDIRNRNSDDYEKMNKQIKIECKNQKQHGTKKKIG